MRARAVLLRGPFFIESLCFLLSRPIPERLSSRSRLLFVRKNLTYKSKEPCIRITPCLPLQARFAASFFEELFARQMMFDRHLRQEKPSLSMKNHQQAMSSEFNRLRGNWRWHGKKRDLNGELGELLRAHGRKARIFQRSAGGAADDGIPQRFIGLNDADASLQSPTDMQRHEHPAAFREHSVTWDSAGKLAVGNSFDDSSAGK